MNNHLCAFFFLIIMITNHCCSTEAPTLDSDSITSATAPLERTLIKMNSSFIKESDLHIKKPILAYNFPLSLFLEYSEDGKELTLFGLDEHSVAVEHAKIAVPSIAGKVLFDADILKDNFVIFKFGEFLVEDKHDNLDSAYVTIYKSIEQLVWDFNLSSSDSNHHALFKIENSISATAGIPFILSDSYFIDPENILVCESQEDADHNVSGRYYMYNLKSRSQKETVLVFDQKYVYLHFNVDKDGTYDFLYCSEDAQHRYSNIQNFYKIERDSVAGQHKKGDRVYQWLVPIYSYPSSFRYSSFERNGGFIKSFIWKEKKIVPNLTELHVIDLTKINLFRDMTSERSCYNAEGKFIDLTEQKATEERVLTEEETAALRSIVYDLTFVGNFFAYKTNFLKPEWHITSKSKIETPKECFAKDILWVHAKLHELFGDPFADLASQRRLLNDLLAPMVAGQELYDEQDQLYLEGIRRFVQSIYFERSVKRTRPNLPYDLMAPLQTATIKSADGEFDMPVYYTLPKMKHLDSRDPFIIEVHGGPHCREFNRISPEQQLWTNRGYAHFRFNPRGSCGFGEKFYDATDQNWWGCVDDIASLVKWVKENNYGRTPIIMGQSFGGYATVAAYEKGISDIVMPTNLWDTELCYEVKTSSTPERTIHDLQSLIKQVGKTDEIRKRNAYTTYMKMTPEERAEQRKTTALRDERSPGNVLICAGLKDYNCLPEGAFRLFDTLKKRGDSVELITMAEEEHDIGEKENRIMVFRAQETFLANIFGDVNGDMHELGGYSTVVTTPGVGYYRANRK